MFIRGPHGIPALLRQKTEAGKSVWWCSQVLLSPAPVLTMDTHNRRQTLEAGKGEVLDGAFSVQGTQYEPIPVHVRHLTPNRQ